MNAGNSEVRDVFPERATPVIGPDGQEIGRVRIVAAASAGIRTPEEGAILEADWGADSAILYAARGNAVLSRSGGRDFAFRVREVAGKKAYSAADPLLHPGWIAAALAGPAEKDAWEAALLPAAERFLDENFDAWFLDVPRFGRRPTGREYAYLSERAPDPSRICLATAFPPLIPYLVAGTERRDPSKFRRITDAVDRDVDAVLPILAEEFGTDLDAVRALHCFTAPYPYGGWAQAIGDVRFDCAAWARTLALIPSAVRPETDEACEAFADLISWTDMLLMSADFRDRRVLPEIAAELWTESGGPVRLPDWMEVQRAWSDAYAAEADRAFPGAFRGEAGGGEAVMGAGTWTVAAMLSASDPMSLLGPYSPDPASLRDAFAYARERFGLVECRDARR